jgi:rubredoxin
MCIYIYVYRDENPSTKSTRRVEANWNRLKENQNNPNSSNEVEDLMLKGHPLSQIS